MEQPERVVRCEWFTGRSWHRLPGPSLMRRTLNDSNATGTFLTWVREESSCGGVFLFLIFFFKCFFDWIEDHHWGRSDRSVTSRYWDVFLRSTDWFRWVLFQLTPGITAFQKPGFSEWNWSCWRRSSVFDRCWWGTFILELTSKVISDSVLNMNPKCYKKFPDSPGLKCWTIKVSIVPEGRKDWGNHGGRTVTSLIYSAVILTC